MLTLKLHRYNAINLDTKIMKLNVLLFKVNTCVREFQNSRLTFFEHRMIVFLLTTTTFTVDPNSTAISKVCEIIFFLTCNMSSQVSVYTFGPNWCSRSSWWPLASCVKSMSLQRALARLNRLYEHSDSGWFSRSS